MAGPLFRLIPVSAKCVQHRVPNIADARHKARLGVAFPLYPELRGFCLASLQAGLQAASVI